MYGNILPFLSSSPGQPETPYQFSASSQRGLTYRFKTSRCRIQSFVKISEFVLEKRRQPPAGDKEPCN